jgi:hypothetical protein
MNEPVLRSKVFLRITLALTLCLVVGAAAASAHRILRLYGGVVTADAITYLAFGKNLHDGTWFLGGPLGECLEHFAPRGVLREGPIWNTHVLPSGKAVYTVAVGYPAFQALLLKAGGVWISLHVNIGLLVCGLVLLTLCIWDGFGRDARAFALGGTASVVLMVSQTRAFANFAYPWREPLFYVCVLGGAWCMLRFARGRGLAALGGSGLLLGLACSVKEACIVYAGLTGLFFLCLPAFRDPAKWPRYLAVVCLAGAIGLSPLLIQNLVCTGNPLTSLQFMRAAPHYAEGSSVPDGQAGLRLRNLRYVVFWYYHLYKTLPLFQWPFLALACLGIWPALGRPTGRLLLVLTGGHLFLYLQWGRGDFRHMYFAHVGYALLVAGGIFLLIDAAGKLVPDRWRTGIRTLYPWPAVLLSLWSTPYFLLGTEKAPAFNYSRAASLVRVLRTSIPSNAVVLSNRKLRDVLIAHQLGEVIRLEDLRWFHPEGNHAPVLDWLLKKGAPIYFLDNQDLDPANAARQNLMRSDLRRLSDSHDLVPVEELPAADMEAAFLVGSDTLTLYRVEPRRHRSVSRTLEPPPEGASFLYLYPRDLSERLEVKLDGLPIRPDLPGDPLYPCTGRAIASPATLSIHAQGAPLPAFREARLIGWNDDLRWYCGVEALPDDRFMLPGTDQGELLPTSRSFTGPFRVRVPVRETETRFTVIGLGLTTQLRGSNEVLVVSGPGFQSVPTAIAGDAAWVAIPQKATNLPFAGHRELNVALSPPAEVRLKRVISRSALTRIDLPDDPKAFGFLLLGTLLPADPGKTASAWRLKRGDLVLGEGEITADPRRGRNRLLHVLHEPAAAPPLQIEGAGVTDLAVLPLGEILSIPERWSLCRTGFYPREWSGTAHFAWTNGRGVIPCPAEVAEAGRTYRLNLSVANGHPDIPPRDLLVRIAGAETVISLPAERIDIQLDLDLPGPLPRKLHDLILESDTWAPAEVRETNDQRRLGFQFYGLQWRPLDESLERDGDP